MKLARHVALVSAIVVGVGLLALVPATSAEGALPAIPGYGFGASPYSLGQIPVPPYFAIHPPVYYSYPVPRTYGYSPYAYPATVMTPETIAPRPQTITNPHVAPQAASDDERVAGTQPQTIVNPFCSTGQTVAADEQ